MQAQDALNEIARQRPRDLFKPLRVHFIGEDGIDAGGVKKEFFQLLVTELLCPDYGMLVFQAVRRPLLSTFKLVQIQVCSSATEAWQMAATRSANIGIALALPARKMLFRMLVADSTSLPLQS